jgi:hypothetical protein
MNVNDVWYTDTPVGVSRPVSSYTAPLPSLSAIGGSSSALSEIAPARYAPAPVELRPAEIIQPVYSHPVSLSSGGKRIPGTVTTVGVRPSTQDLTVGSPNLSSGGLTFGTSSASRLVPGMNPAVTISPVSSRLQSSVTQSPGQVFTPSVLPQSAQFQPYDESRLIGTSTVGDSLEPSSLTRDREIQKTTSKSTSPITGSTVTRTTIRSWDSPLRTSSPISSLSTGYLEKVGDDPIRGLTAAQSYIDSLLERTRILEEEAAANKAHLDTIARIRPPNYRYNISMSGSDLFFLTFVYPDRSVITHAFDRREPLDTVLAQIQYDNRSLEQTELVVRGGGGVTCNPSLDLGSCGLSNGQIIDVTLI